MNNDNKNSFGRSILVILGILVIIGIVFYAFITLQSSKMSSSSSEGNINVTEIDKDKIEEEKNKDKEKENSFLAKFSSLRDSDGDDDDDTYERKAIIIYYSFSGTTEKVAKYIAEKTGYELVKLETHKVYPQDEILLEEDINNEKANFIYPKLKNDLYLNDYDLIYLGFPIWYSDLARPVYSFLDEEDLSNKIIAPFICSDNYGEGSAVSLIQNFEPKSVVLTNPLTITKYNRDDYKKYVDSWLDSVKTKLENY